MSLENHLSSVEKGIEYIRKQHKLYEEGKIESTQYEMNCEDCLQKIDEALIQVRHTYLPMQIPKLLRFDEMPPKWLNISEKGIKEYKSIVQDNEISQEMIMRRFRRPGMRKENIERALKLLSIEQSKLYNAELWKMFSNYFEEIKLNARLNILPDKKVSSSLVEDLQNAMTEQDIEEFTTTDELSLFLATEFSEEGCLEKGIKSASIEGEVAIIAAAACKIAPAINQEDVVGVVLPYVAMLHQNYVIEDAKKLLPEMHTIFSEAVSLVGETVTLADFAVEGTLPDTVKDAIYDCLIYDDMDQLVAKFNEAGKATIRASQNYKQARAILGCAMLSIQDPRMSQMFVAGLRWCSTNTLQTFSMGPLFLMAFDEITTLIPDFDSIA